MLNLFYLVTLFIYYFPFLNQYFLAAASSPQVQINQVFLPICYELHLSVVYSYYLDKERQFSVQQSTQEVPYIFIILVVYLKWVSVPQWYRIRVDQGGEVP